MVEQIPTGMRQAEIDPRKIGRRGHQLVGQSEALTRWIAVLMKASTRTRDRHEKRICDDILSGMFEDMERVQSELAVLANKTGALHVTDEFIEPTDLH